MTKVEDLADYFNERFELIRRNREFVGDDPEEREEALLAINNECVNMRAEIVSLKNDVEKWKAQLREAQRCLATVRDWTARSADQREIPPQALRKTRQQQQAPSLPSTLGDKQGQAAKQEPNRGAPKPKLVVTNQVEYVTMDQYDAIPKYMKGRATYETINAAVDELNAAIIEKYTFLSRKMAELPNPSAKRKHQALRAQETKDTKGLSFVTSEELKNCAHLKSETNRRNLLTILRHFGKIREIRGPGSIVRFVSC